MPFKMTHVDHSLNFSPLEWEWLCAAPVYAGLTVVDAHPSGWLGTLEELKSLRQFMEGHPKDHPLVQEVKASILAQDLIGPERETSFEEMREKALFTLKKLAPVLPERTDPEAHQAYLQFVKTLMLKVAGAAREGGLLGNQTDNISVQERAVMDELCRALDPEH